EAVAVHDRDPLDPGGRRAGLGDIGDARVEHARSARDRLVCEPRAFVRRAPQVSRYHDIALAGELASLVDVIDITADGITAVRSRLHEPGDQRLRAPAAPLHEVRRRD